ncbi:MAG: hypothetical protein K8R60_18725 [Burkholderiales bacterium]|nr:hypothetical protein [Burkholderiales bacterium]
MDTSATPVCPDCGFRIYNRRFPNCEACGAGLPESLVYSPIERFEFQLEEEERSLAKARRTVQQPFSITTPGSLDDSVLSAVLELTER